MNKIYETLISHGRLSKAHADELKAKRGFTPETIQDGRFISGGEYLKEVYNNVLLKEFKEEQLIRAGIAVKNGKGYCLSPLLEQERVIIPYLDGKGKTYYIRPHKLGLKSIPIEIYQKKNFRYGEPLIITEGEFKAAAAVQMGFSSVAVPGVGSFSKDHFPTLEKTLKEFQIKEVFIIFDNEVKDDPKFGNYKDDPWKRYDTQYYAYIMAKMLCDGGFEARIGVLPDEWRTGGKIDIDGALAAGKTASDLKEVISTSLSPANFLKQLPDKVQKIILKKVSRRNRNSYIRDAGGYYVATRGSGDKAHDEKISNFTITIKSTHDTPEGMVRKVVFTNEVGKKTPAFSLVPENMNRSDKFSTFCLSKGNFLWLGKNEDLNHIWEGQFVDDDGKFIVEPDHIGWLESQKLFLFGNVCVTPKGEVLRPDDNNVIWIDENGLKPNSLSIQRNKSELVEGLPVLSLEDCDKHEIKMRLSEAIGERYAQVCLGWVTACGFMPEVFQQYGCFPFLFLTGKRRSGKSTVAEWLMNFFGLENSGIMIADTTAVGLQRLLSYFSSLPVFLDEYRNTKNIIPKNSLLRSAYNHQSAIKGIKSDYGVREAKTRGTLLIAGEETPSDNALLTRCVVIQVSEMNRTKNHFDWFTANAFRFSNYFLQILKDKNGLKNDFMEVLNEGKAHLVEQGIDERMALHYAIVAAGYAVGFDEGSKCNDVEFAQWITDESKRLKQEHDDESAAGNFLNGLLTLKTRRKVNCEYWAIEGGKIYLWVDGLYEVWSQEYRKTYGTEPFKLSAIRDYLKEEGGFITYGERKRITGKQIRCMLFEYENAPEQLKSLVDDLQSGPVLSHCHSGVTPSVTA